MGIEIELKLDVSPRAAKRLVGAPWLKELASAPPKKARLVSVYYDTPDFRLRGKRAALRVRKIDGKHVQTFKFEGDAAQGFLGRGEWECELESPKPNVTGIKGKRVNGLHPSKLEGKLKPMFETAVTRTAIPVRWDDSEVEIAIDMGAVKTGRRQAPIHEIEVELKRGDPAAVIALGARIAADLRAAYGVESKAERGYALREGKTRAAIYAAPVVLEPEMTAGQAFKVIGLSCLHHFAANRAAVAAGDRDGVHQMRVGLRRLRAAISVFMEVLRDPETEAIKQELEWLGEQLGPARDLDVLIDNTIANIEEQGVDPAAVRALKREVVRKRAAALTGARAAVRGERYRKLVLRTAFWVAGGQWTSTDDPLMSARRERKVAGFAVAELSRRRHKIAESLEKLKKLNDRKRHKLRIHVKKLRYAAEFFESLFGGHGANARGRAFGKALKSLQTSLGELNDMRVHGRLAEELIVSTSTASQKVREVFAMGLVAGEERAKSAKLLSDAAKAGKRLVAVKPFWKA
ncbi:MAG TPA: CHAD domain-containing protein [Rhizomicrobium sp.]|jgi:inorganic triphosphatase YgiF|nr:CHAD domain-containing protein [Rhizomicrobium sp.]